MHVRNQLPSLYRAVPSEQYQYEGIVQLLLYFQWTWIGIIAKDDDNGDKFMLTLIPMLLQCGICIALSEKTPAISHAIDKLSSFKSILHKASYLSNSKVNVLVVNADYATITCITWTIFFFAMVKGIEETSIGKVWIMTAQWDFSSETLHRTSNIQVFDGALSFVMHSKEVVGFRKFLQFLHPKSPKGDGFLIIFWQQAFNCFFSDSNQISKCSDKCNNNHCTGEEKLESLPGTLFEMSFTGQSYSIYNAVHAIAHTLHRMYSSRLKHRAMPDRSWLDHLNVQPWKVIFHITRGLQCAAEQREEERAMQILVTNGLTFIGNGLHTLAWHWQVSKHPKT